MEAGREQGKQTTRDEVSIDLRGLFAVLWSGKWTIVIVTFAATAIALAFALMATPWYRADVVVSPVDQKSGGLNLGQLGGLASLAGISVPGSSSSQVPLAVLRSREFAREFIESHSLEASLLSASSGSGLSRFLGDASGKPDFRDAVRFFTERVRFVTEDKKTGLITLSIRWKDPELAAEWANEMVIKANEKLRGQALAEAERNIRFLQRQMAETSVVALQQSVGRVLETEMQKLLLAKGSEQFAFKIIDSAAVPKFKDGLRRLYVVLLGILLGGFASCCFLLMRRSFQ